MIRLAHSLVVLLLLLTAPVDAQDAPQPLVEIELSETEVIPGQPTVLRMTVLVPTWLPKPVAFPTLEAPDLMVKLLERATNPTSRTVDGETWSGVTRAYRLSPMVPGPISIPPQELVVTWAEPGQTDPIVSTVTSEGFTITGIVPEGAEALDPFIAANDLTLTQDLSSDARTLTPGDSLIRTVTVDVSGTSPLFVPILLPPHQIEGVASYPDEPVVTETADRTWLSGTRVESTTLVAQSGGSGPAPAIELQWYNLDSGQVETARVEGFDLTVDAPVQRTRPDIDIRSLLIALALAAIAAWLAFRLLRAVLPKAQRWRLERRAAHMASEGWAFAQVKRAVAARDYASFARTYAIWQSRMPSPWAIDAALNPVVTRLGASLYGTGGTNTSKTWAELSEALAKVRSDQRAHAKKQDRRATLAPLNPH